MPVIVATAGPGLPRPNQGGEAKIIALAVATVGGVFLKRVLVPIARRSPIGFAVSAAVYLVSEAFQGQESRTNFLEPWAIAAAPVDPLTVAIEMPPMWKRDP